MHASIVGGHSLDDTLAGLNRITDSFTGRVQGLVENEMVRAFDTGGDIALQAVGDDHAVTEVWVTRADRLVCGICAPRHMKVTALQPITDSHPGCRCRKVPVPDDFTYTDVDYDDLFDSAFGGERAMNMLIPNSDSLPLPADNVHEAFPPAKKKAAPVPPEEEEPIEDEEEDEDDEFEDEDAEDDRGRGEPVEDDEEPVEDDEEPEAVRHREGDGHGGSRPARRRAAKAPAPHRRRLHRRPPRRRAVAPGAGVHRGGDGRGGGVAISAPCGNTPRRAGSTSRSTRRSGIGASSKSSNAATWTTPTPSARRPSGPGAHSRRAMEASA